MTALQATYDSEIENAVVRTMSYFDIFNYPLKVSEVLNFLSIRSSSPEVEQTLNKLAGDKQIFKLGDFYSLQFDEAVFDRRKKGNALADALLPEIVATANFIFRFPFVRSVMASGSFSKNFMDEKSDFDFFIVCAPQRLWISRMLLVLYKRLFLKSSHKYFCVNYFIDEANLTIDEKNIFTATELATVFPLTGQDHYQKLIAMNQTWLSGFFPNFQKRESKMPQPKNNALKNLIEKLVNLFFGSTINRWFKNIMLNRWKKIYGHLYSSSDFKVAFKSTEKASKNHPRNFQKKIIDEFNTRVSRLSKQAEVYE